MGICGIEVFRPAMEVCEIAAASAGDQNLPADAICALQDDGAAPAFSRFDCAQESSGSSAQDYHIIFVSHSVRESPAKFTASERHIPGRA